MADVIRAGGEILRSDVHKLINCTWNKKEFPDQWKEFVILIIYKEVYESDFSNYRLHIALYTKFNGISFLKVKPAH
jgi:hypothetical protein